MGFAFEDQIEAPSRFALGGEGPAAADVLFPRQHVDLQQLALGESVEEIDLGEQLDSGFGACHEGFEVSLLSVDLASAAFLSSSSASLTPPARSQTPGIDSRSAMKPKPTESR